MVNTNDFLEIDEINISPLNRSQNISNLTLQNLVKSLSLLQAAVSPNLVFVFYGIVAVISNTILICAVWKSKSLHSKCFVLLAINGLIDLMLGAGYGTTGAIRVYRYHSGSGDVHTMWGCFLEVGFNVYMQLLALGMAPALVAERLYAAFFPQKYKNLTYRQFTIPLIIAVNLYALAQFSVHFYNSYMDGNKVLYTCGVPDTLSTDGAKALTGIQIGTSVMVVTLNCILGYRIRIQNKKVKIIKDSSTNTAANKPKDKDQKCYKTIFLISLLHIICHLFGRLVIFVATSFATDETMKAMINRWGRTLIILNAATHFFLLYATSTIFCSAAKDLIWKNRVQAASPGGASDTGMPASRIRVIISERIE